VKPLVSSRERILSAATELFLENGYLGTGMQELSDVVGLSRGALYHHIDSKEELLYEISISLLRPVTESARQIVFEHDDPSEGFRLLARELLEHHARHGDAWSVVLREANLLSSQHYADVMAARDEYEAVWATVLAVGTRRNMWRNIDSVEIRGILGLFNGAAKWMQPDGALTPVQIADKYVDLVLFGIAR